MQIQPVAYNSQQINTLINFINSHNFDEGIYLVKRKSVITPVMEHYGIAILGKYLNYFDSSWKEPKVIHKTNLGVHADSFHSFDWEKVEKISNSTIYEVIMRTNLSQYDVYNLLVNNCEHFARFVTTGKKESSQVQNAFGLGLISLITYLVLRDDN